VRERRILLLILASYAIVGGGFSFLMPPWEAPDEYLHYRRILADCGFLKTDYGNPESQQPPLYYRLAGAPIRLLAWIDPRLIDPVMPPGFQGLLKQLRSSPDATLLSLEPQVLRVPTPFFPWNAGNFRFMPGVYLLRWLNLILGGAAVYLVYLGSRHFVSTNEVALAAAATAGLLPQFLHICASISNDPLAYLAGAYLFLQLGRICSRDQGPWTALQIAAAALCLPLLTKLTVAPMSLAVLAALGWDWNRRRTASLRLLPLASGLLLVGLAIGAIYLASPQGFDSLLRQAKLRLILVRPDALEQLPEGLLVLATSFWALLGWMEVGLPKSMVIGLTLIAAVGLISSLGWRAPRVATRERSIIDGFALSVLWLAALLAGLALAKNYAATYWGIQARLLFPSLGVASLLIVLGWRFWLPPAAARRLPDTIVYVGVVLNVWIWLEIVIPIYYQPLLG